MQEQEALLTDIEALLSPQGISLLEFVVSRHHGSVQVRAVIHVATGTGIAECSKAHKLIAARLAEAHGIEEPFIEVSSPGIDRQFRSRREYVVFAGSRIRFILEGESEWQRARLIGIEGDIVSLETAAGVLALPFATIGKARLDSTSEGD